MIAGHFTAIAAGFLLDRLIGDPKHLPHPVRWIGSYISMLTNLLNKGKARVLKGAVMLFVTAATVTAAALLITYAAYKVHILAGIAVEAVLIGIALAQKSLQEAAMDVYLPLQAGDAAEARLKVSYIVGRDTEQLNESGIVRATVETVSENTSDGVTAPLFFAFLLGAPGIWLYKAVNTLDSMIGYKDERYGQFGKWSARADDVLNFIPSRLTGLLILLCAKNEGGLPFSIRLRLFLTDAKRHMSPNSGYLEAATACQLNISLGGESTYRGIVSRRPVLNSRGRPARTADIRAAVAQMHTASLVFLLIILSIGGVLYALS